MGGQKLTTPSEETLGVMILNDLKLSTQCAMTAKTAQTVVGQLAKSAGFHYRDRHNLVRLWQIVCAATYRILYKALDAVDGS